MFRRALVVVDGPHRDGQGRADKKVNARGVRLVQVELNQHRHFDIRQREFVAESKQLPDPFLAHEKLDPQLCPALERNADERAGQKACPVFRPPQSILRRVEQQRGGVQPSNQPDLLRRCPGRYQYGGERQQHCL